MSVPAVPASNSDSSNNPTSSATDKAVPVPNFAFTIEHRAIGSLEEAGPLLLRLGELHTNVDAMVGEVLTQRNRKRAELFTRYAEATTDMPDGKSKRDFVKVAEEKADKEADLHQKYLLSDGQTLDARLKDVLRQAENLERRFAATMVANPSPLAMLDASGNDDSAALQKKVGLAAWFAKSGPAAIANAAAAALVSGDAITCSAIAQAIEQLPKNLRSISSSEIADRIFGAKHAQLSLAAKKAKLVLDTARDKVADLRNGSGLVRAKTLQRALLQREIDIESDKVFGDSVSQSPISAKTPTERIAAGLNDLEARRR